ncbi:MAG: response regulator [Gemmatimonadales bacterium]|nr:response regulator [Gemmatimonadales bacterium]
MLIANDHEWTARSLETILVAAGMRVVRTLTGHETLAVAARVLPDLLILDLQLPDISGVNVCSQLRADPRFGASTPILITTAGPSGRQQRLAAYEAGAWEFYGQPLDGEALLHKVRVFLAARLESVQAMRQNLFDNATGLYTRAGMERRATELASEARRTGGGMACVAIAAVRPGSRESDRIAAILRSRARASDAAGRLGPDSFAVLAGGIGPDGAARLAERLRAAAAEEAGGAEWRIAITSLDDSALAVSEPTALLAHAALEVAA